MSDGTQEHWRQDDTGRWEYLGPDGAWIRYSDQVLPAAIPQPAYQSPFAYPVVAPKNGQAVASLVLGIGSIVVFVGGLVTLAVIVLAIVFGSIGIGKANKGFGGKGMATAGLVLGICGGVAYILFGLFTLGVGFLV